MIDNKYKTYRISSLLQQSRVKNLYTDNQYNEYLEFNDIVLGGIGEVVGDDTKQVKPYFDFDSTDVNFDVSFQDEISLFIKDTYQMNIACMNRANRILDNNKTKSSLRIYIQNCRISSYLIPEYFKELFNKYSNVIDTSVYSKKRILLTLGNKYKVNETVPPLTIIGDHPIETVFATYIEEGFKDLNKLVDKNLIKLNPDVINEVKKQMNEIEEEQEDDNKNKIFDIITDIINHIKPYRSTKYEDWFSFTSAIMATFRRHKLPKYKAIQLIHNFSELSDNYDEDKVDKFIDNNYDKQMITEANQFGLPYLLKCLKEDDPDYYNENFSKTYIQQKITFEKTYAKIMHPDCIIYNCNNKAEIIAINSLAKAYRHFKCLVKNPKKPNTMKSVSFINTWLEDSDMRVYKEMEYLPPPLKVPHDVYNLWTPFKISLLPYTPNQKVIDLFLEFGENLLGKEYMNYSLAIFANKIQKPATRSNVLQILYSPEEGTGKNTWFDIFMNVIGNDKYAQFESALQIYGSHNCEEKGRLFIQIDEARGIDNYTNADKLKSRITCDRLTIDPKGIQAYEIVNRCDYVSTTNNHNCIPQNDQSRRFAPQRVSNYYLGNIEFFTKIYKQIINNDEALRCIYEYLLNFNVSEIIPTGNFQNHIPKTEFMEELNTDNKNRVDLFVEAIANGEIDFDADDDIIITINKTELFQKFVQWCSINKFECKYSSISFGRKLSNLIKSKDLPIIAETKRKTTINLIELKAKLL